MNQPHGETAPTRHLRHGAQHDASQCVAGQLQRAPSGFAEHDTPEHLAQARAGPVPTGWRAVTAWSTADSVRARTRPPPCLGATGLGCICRTDGRVSPGPTTRHLRGQPRPAPDGAEHDTPKAPPVPRHPVPQPDLTTIQSAVGRGADETRTRQTAPKRPAARARRRRPGAYGTTLSRATAASARRCRARDTPKAPPVPRHADLWADVATVWSAVGQCTLRPRAWWGGVGVFVTARRRVGLATAAA